VPPDKLRNLLGIRRVEVVSSRVMLADTTLADALAE